MAWTPSTFHKSKRQQSSLQTDSSRESFESSGSGVKSPKTCLMNYEKFMQPLHQHSSDSDPGFYLTKHFKSSEKKAFDFELSSTTKHLKSSSHRLVDSLTTDSAPATLNSPMKKCEYNAVSSENSAGKSNIILFYFVENFTFIMELRQYNSIYMNKYLANTSEVLET